MLALSNDTEVAWRRQRLLAGARPRRHSQLTANWSLRQRAGLALVQVGLSVAGGLTVGALEGLGEPQPR